MILRTPGRDDWLDASASFSTFPGVFSQCQVATGDAHANKACLLISQMDEYLSVGHKPAGHPAAGVDRAINSK